MIVYPGTFDPITRGHANLVERAVTIFDAILVAVAKNPPPSKVTLFNWEQRINMVTRVLKPFYPRVQVKGFDGLLSKFIQREKCRVILRGLRPAELEREWHLASTNSALLPGVETMFLLSSETYWCISSSMVREVARLGGDVSKFVPELVAEALEKIF